MFEPGVAIVSILTHKDLTTGLVDGDWTKYLFKDGVVDATTVTITEKSAGNYSVSFTPATAGFWELVIVETADATAPYQGQGYDVKAAADYKADVSALATQASIDALNDISTAEVNAEVDTALADYDAPTRAELTTDIASVLSAISGLSIPTVANILAGVVETEGSYTLKQALSIILSAVAGVTTDSGATFKTPNGNATRISGTVISSDERTAITLTPSS